MPVLEVVHAVGLGGREAWRAPLDDLIALLPRVGEELLDDLLDVKDVLDDVIAVTEVDGVGEGLLELYRLRPDEGLDGLQGRREPLTEVGDDPSGRVRVDVPEDARDVPGPL